MSKNLLRDNLWTLSVAAVLLVVLCLYTFCFTVEAGTVKVVKYFGRISRIEKLPGLKFKYPWPIESEIKIDTRQRLLLAKGGEELTQDQFNLSSEVAVGWRVSDAHAYITRLEGSTARAEDTLRKSVTDAWKRATNATKLSSIISTDPKQKEAFNAYEANILALVQKSLASETIASGYGIEVSFVKLQRLAFPSTVTQAIFDLMVKERKRISEQYRSEGENQAKMIRTNAERERDEQLANAEGAAIILKGEGDAEAARYYQVFNKNPTLANYVRELDAFRATINKESTVILPSSSVPFRILNQTPPTLKSAAPTGN